MVLYRSLSAAGWLSWLEHTVHTRGVAGSNPVPATSYAQTEEEGNDETDGRSIKTAVRFILQRKTNHV